MSILQEPAAWFHLTQADIRIIMTDFSWDKAKNEMNINKY
jgi:hypothetical protein